MIDPTIYSKYISLVSENLSGFKFLRNGVYNFRCPFCGDSHKNSVKKRGYLIYHKENWFFYCHNCGLSYPFGMFLKNINTEIYKEFKLETFRNNDI